MSDYVTVPKEPTEAMLSDAAYAAFGNRAASNQAALARAYRAMLAAAPQCEDDRRDALRFTTMTQRSWYTVVNRRGQIDVCVNLDVGYGYRVIATGKDIRSAIDAAMESGE